MADLLAEWTDGVCSSAASSGVADNVSITIEVANVNITSN